MAKPQQKQCRVCPTCPVDCCSCYLQKMAQVAEVLPYRLPFGHFGDQSLNSTDPIEMFINCSDVQIQKIVLTASGPLSLGLGNTRDRARQQLTPLPITILLKPHESLFVYTQTPPVAFNSLVEIY